MNEFQLQSLATTELSALRSAIDRELKSRRSAWKLKKRRLFIASLYPDIFNSLRVLNKRILALNSIGLLEPPGLRKTRKQNLSAYLPALLGQDWSRLYPPSEGEQKFYVYAHIDPREPVFVTDSACGGNYGGRPFYIGKGVGDRAFDLKRNQGHGQRIRQILDDGYGPSDIVRVIFSELDEGFAFEIEAKLIYFFGTIYQRGEEHGCLLNLEIPPTPSFEGEMEPLVTSRAWKEARGIREAFPSMIETGGAENA